MSPACSTATPASAKPGCRRGWKDCKAIGRIHRLPDANSRQARRRDCPGTFDASSGAETPFGHRWGGDIFRLSTEHIAALQAGQTLALDVQSEYIAFLKAAESAKMEQAIKANLRGLGYGG